MTNVLSRVAIFCSLALSVGCGATTGDTVVEVEPVDTQAKQILQDIAESGQLGSSVMELREELEKMKGGPEAAKAKELLTDLEELEKVKNPKDVKKKAAAMAEKL
ncbi:MAG: hypothetical protein Fues2KO_11680 [Fuerstiella sp.]